MERSHDEDRRRAAQHRDAERAAHQRDLMLRDLLEGALRSALRDGPDALAGLQRADGHELVRLNLLHPQLCFVDSAGVVADRLVPMPLPAPVIEVHDASNLQLLALVEQRLHDDRSIWQDEREQLAQLARSVLKRLGTLPGR